MQNTTSLLLILWSFWSGPLMSYHPTICDMSSSKARMEPKQRLISTMFMVKGRRPQLWFHRFRSGDKSVEDEPRSTFDESKLLQLLNENNRQTTRELAEALSVSHAAVGSNWDLWRLGTWLPHDLSDTQKWQRMSVAHFLLSRYERKSFLPRLVTRNEKWVTYVSFQRKRQWVCPGQTPSPDVEPDTHQKRLCSVFPGISKEWCTGNCWMLELPLRAP